MNQNRIVIETHRGHEIIYDADYDKFITEVAVPKETSKTIKRQSLKDIRHEIDLYLKVNADFKPFKALLVNRGYRSSGGDIEVKEISSVRSDGIFIAKARWGSDQIKLSHLKSSGKAYDEAAIIKQAEIEGELKIAQAKRDIAINELIASLKPLDLSAYDYLNEKD